MSTYGYIKHDEMSDYAIAHHGIKGQKWGIRRFQNEDGSLTPAGRRRYNINWAENKPGWYYKTGQSIQDQHKMYKDIKKSFKKENKGISNEELDKQIQNEYKRIYKENSDTQYGLGKSAYDFLNKGNKFALAGAGGAVVGAIDALAQSKIEGSPVDRHNKYRDEILKITGSNLKNDYSSIGKKYEKKNGTYKHPKTREDAIDIIKYDRDKTQKSGSGFGGTFYESGNILNPTHQLIYHYSDKNGNIALSYCRVPGYGDIYVKGSGNINDVDMNKFKKPPKKIED